MEEEINKEVKYKEIPKDHKQLVEEFFKRQLTITSDADGKEISKTYNAIQADKELFARFLNILDAMEKMKEAFAYLANEWDKYSNPDKIITKEDPNFNQFKP